MIYKALSNIMLETPNESDKKQIRSDRIKMLKLQLKPKITVVKKQQASETDTISSSISQSSDHHHSGLHRIPSILPDHTQPTDIFHSKYEILCKLGEGANGIVFKCSHKMTKKKYAVKKLSFDIENVGYLKRSFGYMKNIDHPSIIKYKSLYISLKERTGFLVMEFFDSTDLQSYEIRGETEVRDIAQKLLLAVEYLHYNGICHRDIKPDNILYDPLDRQIKLIDFGVSKRTKVGKMKQQLLTCTGTLKYKAPQMFKYSIYTEAVDEWAVGVTLYKMIAGVTPFESDYISQTIENIEKGKVQFSDPVWKNYSPYVQELIQSLLSPVKQRITAKQALKHIWFTDHISPGRVGSLRKRGYTAKETMQLNWFETKVKLVGKYSIPEEQIAEQEQSPCKMSRKLMNAKLTQSYVSNFEPAQYDSDNSDN